eukprot:scaffold1557_cov246-Pinguiococcus_pyrenoidosus.AAC.10
MEKRDKNCFIQETSLSKKFCLVSSSMLRFNLAVENSPSKTSVRSSTPCKRDRCNSNEFRSSNAVRKSPAQRMDQQQRAGKQRRRSARTIRTVFASALSPIGTGWSPTLLQVLRSLVA